MQRRTEKTPPQNRFNESNGKFRQIIDLYNSVKPLPRGYAVQYNDHWCATTTSAAGIKAGCSDLVGREYSREELIAWAKKKGIAWTVYGFVHSAYVEKA
ncbi:MAG: hypothetical protein Q4A32_09670 [Lachnospiraceae bacterium]|nr:hypothetical protein [Lachnospiraceae bacterium]